MNKANLRFDGVPVGGFVVEARYANILAKLLRVHGWLKTSGVKVTPFKSDRLPGCQPPGDDGQVNAIYVIDIARDRWKDLVCDGERDVALENAEDDSRKECTQQGLIAVHLNTKGAAVMESIVFDYRGASSDDDRKGGSGIEEEREILSVASSIGALWVPKLRVRSKECLGAFRSKAVLSSNPSSDTSQFRFIELFAGIGGFRLGLEPLGGRGRCSGMADGCGLTTGPVDRLGCQLNAVADEVETTDGRRVGTCKEAVTSLSLGDNKDSRGNLALGEAGQEILVGDITEIDEQDIPDHDLLTAGFPCQSFCKVGPKTGLSDTRGELFFEIVRVLHGKRPKAFLLENVANLLEFDGGETFALILSHLRGEGYHVHWRVIDAADFLPQVRKRVYFVGLREDLAASADAFEWPIAKPSTQTLRDILDPDPPAADLILTDRQISVVMSTRAFRPSNGHAHGGWTWRTADVDGKARTLMSSYKSAFRLCSEFVPVPLPPLSPSSNRNDLIRPLRFYSPKECARIMGFPDTIFGELWAKDSERRALLGEEDGPLPAPNAFYHMIGNAVCPPVIRAIGEPLVAQCVQGSVDSKSADMATSLSGVRGVTNTCSPEF
ncbi:hypothetical protein HDU67_006450 [Dinochytrium kinnereticum]|nr:hypothetical protein HDU67_006450 [Dinochytrium kinnereticum]